MKNKFLYAIMILIAIATVSSCNKDEEINKTNSTTENSSLKRVTIENGIDNYIDGVLVKDNNALEKQLSAEGDMELTSIRTDKAIYHFSTSFENFRNKAESFRSGGVGTFALCDGRWFSGRKFWIALQVAYTEVPTLGSFNNMAESAMGL